MYLWQIEYNVAERIKFRGVVVNRFKLCIFDRLNTTADEAGNIYFGLWIALNYVSLTDWIQHMRLGLRPASVVNRFKLCIFDRLNTTLRGSETVPSLLWIALNYVSLTDWIQLILFLYMYHVVVNRFKLCIFDRLNTTSTMKVKEFSCCESL